jgi:LPXTG-motif cell wall-anchored protein
MHMSRTTLRPSLAALTLLTAVVASLVAPAGAADAAAYRFWGYFQLTGSSWQFAPKGPDQLTPADGAVEGWRFAVAGETDTRAPRVRPTFDAVCAGTKAETGKKRVAVVIDYGRAADQEDGTAPPAPVAKCAAVATAATGAEVLAAVASVRSEKGLVCSLDNHPATGCGGPVKAVSAAAAAPDTALSLAPKAAAASTPSTPAAASNTGGSSALQYAGIGLVILALLGLGAVVLRRRGRLGQDQV